MLATLEGEEKVVPEGGQITIRPWQYHTFRNASSEEDLQVMISLAPGEGGSDERFFRNIHSYLADCKREGKNPSFIQLLLFFYYGETFLALP
jgi:hypothetical protein